MDHMRLNYKIKKHKKNTLSTNNNLHAFTQVGKRLNTKKLNIKI